jgi:hypothetical protein
MNWLRTTGSELIGLFVDDGRFALAIVVWLVACGLVLSRIDLPSALPPLILFIGLVLILAWSALRRAGSDS